MNPQVRTALTMSVMVALLAIGGFWALTAATKPLPKAPEKSTDPCRMIAVKAGDPVTPDQVQVSVFNAGTRSGLAERTLGLFADQGFAKGKVGNAGKSTRVSVAEIWADDPEDPAVRLVASRMPGVEIIEGPRLGQGVLVVVGDKFDGLSTGRRSVKATSDTEICGPLSSVTPSAG